MLRNTAITINGYIKRVECLVSLKRKQTLHCYCVNMNTLVALFFFALQVISALPINTPNIKLVVFKTGNESPEQLALLPRVQAVASLYGDNSVEERSLPSTATYTLGAETLHSTWYKMQVTREIMDANPQVDFVLTFELSALPTDGSAAIDFALIIQQNPSVSVFLKRVGAGFGMAMYKNDKETREVVENIWAKRSARSPVSAAFTTYTFWNPLILTKVKFL